MFSDVLLMKTQLFHTIWPAVDIIPMSSFADASGADASVNGANYYPVSSESTVIQKGHFSVCQTRRGCCLLWLGHAAPFSFGSFVFRHLCEAWSFVRVTSEALIQKSSLLAKMKVEGL